MCRFFFVSFFLCRLCLSLKKNVLSLGLFWLSYLDVGLVFVTKAMKKDLLFANPKFILLKYIFL